MFVNIGMEMRKLGRYIIVLVLVFTVFVVGLKAIEDLHNPLSSASAERVENLAELLWANCGLEMKYFKEAYKDLDFGVVGNSATNILEGDNLLKVLSVVLPQQMQPELFDCLKEKALVLPISGDDESSTSRWYLKLTRYRRHLAGVREDPSRELAADESDKQHSIHAAIIIAVVVTAIVTFIFAILLFICCHKRLGIDISNDFKDDKPLLSISTSDHSGSGGTDCSTNSAAFQSSYRNMSFRSCSSNISDKEPEAAPSEENVETDVVNVNVETDVVNVSVDNVETLPVEEPLNIDPKISSPPSETTPPPPELPWPPLKPPPGRAQPPELPLPPLKPPPGRAQPPELPLPPLKPPPGRAQTPELPPQPPPSLKSPPPPPSASAPPPPSPSAPPPPPPPGGGNKPYGGGGSPPTGPGPPPPPPPGGGNKSGVHPPPLPKGGIQAPNAGAKGGTNTVPRAKLKPFFWDKVLTSPGHTMVWNQIKAGSFQCNEEMIETLFGYVQPDKNAAAQQKESASHAAPKPKFIQLIDAKKAQNLSILMRALNITTEEVCDALEQGNELPPELLETLLKMAPTTDEELKLRLFSGELSQLGPAERFLKVLVDIPFAYKRMETLHFMCSLEEEVRTIKESFLILEAACNELRDSRLFLKLLEAVLKTGNRMNDGTFRGGASAFKLDTLLKLSDVKGVDGKITLLHFVVLEIIRSEGIRAARGAGSSSSFSSVKSTDDFTEVTEDDAEEKMRALGLQVVSGLSGEMEDVKKAAGLDGEVLSASVARLGNSMAKTRKFLNSEMKSIDENNGFNQVLKCFVEEIDEAVMKLVEEENRIAELMKGTADYFHGKPGKEEGLRLFTVVRDFLIMLDKACAQVAENFKKSSSSNNPSHKKDPPPLGKSSSGTHREQPPSKESSYEPPQIQKPDSKQNSTDRTPPQLPPDVRQRFIKATEDSRLGGDSSTDEDD